MSKKKQGMKKGVIIVRSVVIVLLKVFVIMLFECFNDLLLKKIFQFLIIGMVLVVGLLLLGMGINGDDEYQVDYFGKLVDYYIFFGVDMVVFYIEKGNMYYYGGFFDLIIGLINVVFGFDEFDMGYYQVRYVFNVFMGMLVVLFVGFFVWQIVGW